MDALIFDKITRQWVVLSCRDGVKIGKETRWICDKKQAKVFSVFFFYFFFQTFSFLPQVRHIKKQGSSLGRHTLLFSK